MKKSLLILLLMGISFLGVNAKEISVDELKQTAVPEGQVGLVLDSETERYFYQGENVNNYIKFNNELWRILSLEPDGKIEIVSPILIINTSSYKRNPPYLFYDEDLLWSKPNSYNQFLNSTFYDSLNHDKKYIVNGEFYIDEIDGVSYRQKQYAYNVYYIISYNLKNRDIWTGKVGSLSLEDISKSSINDYDSWLLKECDKNLFYTTTYLNELISTQSVYDSMNNSYIFIDNNQAEANRYFSTDYLGIKANAAVYLQPGLMLKGTGTANDPFEIVLKAEEIKPEIKIVKGDKKVDNIVLKKNDTFTYEVSQKVHEVGKNIQNRYSYFSLVAKIPKEVEYLGAKIYDENNNEITDGKIEYNKETNEVTWTANESYLDENSENHMKIEGETYYLRINSKLEKDNISTISAEATLNYKTTGNDELVKTVSNKVVIDTNKVKNPLTSNNMIIVIISSLLVIASLIITNKRKKEMI